MKVFDILWIEDDCSFVDGTLANLKEDRELLGFAIVPWHYVSEKAFEENSHMELDTLHLKLVCVDYHLPEGTNGDAIINRIRSYPANADIWIIFYSAMKTEVELKNMLSENLPNLEGIFYASKDTLADRIQNLLTD